jgi:uncharacterized protein
MTAVDHLIERPTIRPEDGSERTIGRIAQGHHVGTAAVSRYAEDPPAGLLVAHGRMAAADAQVGRGQQHGHGRLAQVVLVDRQVPLGLRLGKDQDDRRLGSGQVSGANPDGRELLKLLGLGHEHEIPPLTVGGRGGSPSRFEDSIEVFGGKRTMVVGAHVTTGSDGVPRFHRTWILRGEPRCRTLRLQEVSDIDDVVEQILTTHAAITVVGASATPAKAAHSVPAHMQRHGWRTIPVNPHAAQILDEHVHRRLADIPEQIGLVDVFRPSPQAADIARQAVAVGATAVWLQLGITSEEARAISESAGLLYVEDRCLIIEQRRLGLDAPKVL